MKQKNNIHKAQNFKSFTFLNNIIFFFSWDYFSHDHARSRVYRWGEDGLLGITDRQCRLCFGLALWNEKDPILKERLFGLTGTEGQLNKHETLGSGTAEHFPN